MTGARGGTTEWHLCRKAGSKSGRVKSVGGHSLVGVIRRPKYLGIKASNPTTTRSQALERMWGRSEEGAIWPQDLIALRSSNVAGLLSGIT